MEPWIKRGFIELGKMMFLFAFLMICGMIIIAICEDLGIHSGWGYAVVLVAAAISVTFGTEKAKYDLEKVRIRTNDKKEEK